jgi:phage internal scaffolding protein
MTKKAVQFATPYDGERRRVVSEPVGESMTQQHFKDEVDVRNIIKRYDSTGLINHVQRGQAQYGDFSQTVGFKEALDMVNSAKESFMELPAELRREFRNDAGEFYTFVSDPNNSEKLIEMGLAKAPEVVEERKPSADVPDVPSSPPTESEE